ncbi:MAG: ATP-dependent helicase [Acidobacteriota bacterium]
MRDTDFERHLEEALNEAQRRAVTAEDGPHRVVAGAGTGKTRTLVYRVAWLVSQGVAPESILLLTFTRRASQEMLRRASTLLDDRCRRVAGGTFHAFANLTLRKHGERLGFHGRFTILDRADAVDLMGILRSESGHDRAGVRFPRASTLVDLMSKNVNTQLPLRDLMEAETPQFIDHLEAVEELQGRYRRRKKEQQVMDYDDLLCHLRDLLTQHAEVRQGLASRYRHVLVDEYQDTNKLQAHISALLATGHRNLMVVGDDAQAIYGFRGASYRNILDFEKIFPGCRDTVLEQNYRSVQPILDLGNAVLKTTRQRIEKKLFSRLEGDEKPVLVRSVDEISQADFVCRRILELREQGVPLGDIAILARAAWHSGPVELELQNRNIPFRKFGGIRFMESAHVKDLVALLRLAANPTDDTSWFRALQFFEGIGPKTARSIANHVLERGGDPRVLVQPKLTRKKYGRSLRDLSELLISISDASQALSARLAAATEQMEKWLPQRYDDATLRAKDFEVLQVVSDRYTDLERFLADLAIEPPDFSRAEANDDTEDEAVTLSTVHSAKGLEWPTVFGLQMNTGRFPNFNAFGVEGEMDEDRRLFYVAITRAKRRLYLLKPEELTTRGQGWQVGELSPLLADLPDLKKLVDERTWYTGQGEEESPSTDSAPVDDRDQLQRIEDYFS